MTNTVSALAQGRAEVDRHFKAVEGKARAHASQMSTILKPGLVMMGAYTTPYLAGVMGMEALTASSERRREIFRQLMANIPEKERNQLFDRAEELSAQFPSVPITAIMSLGRTARNTMGSTERGLQVLERMVEAYVTLQSAKGAYAATSELDGLLRGIDNLGQNSDGEIGVEQTLQLIDALTKASQVEGSLLSRNTFATGLLTRMTTQREQVERLVNLYE
ncbi:MAG TPA: hypothetical protein VNS02_07505 [Rhizobiaceae bacterium]|nr:hypothetical protein [Rhizobiaceae bacterium]